VRYAILRLFGVTSNSARQMVPNAIVELVATGLVKLIHSKYSGNKLSVRPTWEFHIRSQVAACSANGKGRGSDIV